MIRREDHVFCEVANGPLPEFTAMLLKDLGRAQVVDARRPKFGVDMPPVTEQPTQPKPVASPNFRMPVRPFAAT